MKFELDNCESDYWYKVDDYDIRFVVKNNHYMCEINTYPNKPYEFLKLIKCFRLVDNNVIQGITDIDENTIKEYISYIKYYNK